MTTERLGFADTLVRVAHLVNQVFAEVSRDRGLTPQQTQMLCVLAEGPVGMTALRGTLDLEKSSLTGLVDRVERRGLVERVRDTDDRRACRIALTTEGLRAATDAHDEVTARLQRLADDLPAAERELLTAALGRVLAQAQQAEAAAP